MPAIRDFSFNYTAATGTSLTIPLPSYQQNDLLLVILARDTGTGSWSASGYSEIFNQTNTANLTIHYKIAGSSESDPTFTSGTSETLIGSIIAIRDVDTSDPINNFATSNSSTAVSALPTTTTDRDNCLLIFADSHSAVAVPEINIGPVSYLWGADGVQFSAAASWGFQAAQGTTSSSVQAASLSASAQKLAVVAINPPSGGATVIPAYVSADSSVYLDPLNGTTAFNSNTSPAQDPTSIFGTSLQGLTIVSDAASAAADFGLNAYHSTARVTADVGNTWRGSRIQLTSANRPDMTGKALIIHTGPSTPGQTQRIRNVATAQGIAVGMASGATSGNWKIWHTHGIGTPFGALRDVPLVIHPDNTTGVIGSAGTFDKTSVSDICFLVSPINITGTTTTIWDFYSLWALDTLTISGGASTSPVEIGGIIQAIQGHEHRGVVQQATNQMMVLMPIQFGDGGTNPTYLDLNATAIEFPRQYDTTEGTVNFCTVDNWAGITYYAGSSDTISHRNSIISSPSRYKWGLHASTSTSATYDFSGLSVIGAGTVTLNKAITISELTINDYSTLDVSNAGLSGCTVLNPPSSNDSLTTNSSTSFSSCSINTTTVTAGNRWASVATADLDIFSGCTFTGSTTSGHAIRLSSTGSVSFSGNTFTSYGPAARSFNAATGVNTTTDVITLDDTHGYANGEPAYFQDQGGTAPTGLTDGSLYYVRSESSTTITLYDTAAHAIAGGATGRADITATGSGTQYIYSAAAAIYNNSGGAVTITITNGGNIPSYRNSDGSSTTIVASVNLAVHVENETGTDIEAAQVFIRKSGAYYNYTSHNTNNSSGDATFEVNEAIDSDLPQSGWLHVWDSSTNTKQNYRYASWSGTSFTLPAEVSGSATSAGTSTTLNSTGIGALNIQEGDTIRNTTDGSWAIVDELTANSATTTELAGGSDNTWASGDSFSVHRLAVTYDNTDLIDIPLFNGQTDSNGDISTSFGGATPASIVVRVRSNTGATKYVPFSTTGSITSSGYSLTAVLIEDTVAT